MLPHDYAHRFSMLLSSACLQYRAHVTGPHLIPFPPSYIPPEICSPVGQDPATTPVETCMDLVIVDVRDDGVSAARRPG